LGTQANPYLISGMSNGSSGKIISTDPSVSGSIPILRSNNQSTGLEFTWSIWLYIENLGNKGYQHIFNKGDANYREYSTTNTDTLSGISQVNNSPGLYLADASNKSTAANNIKPMIDSGDVKGMVGTYTVDNSNPSMATLRIIMNTSRPDDASSTIDVPNCPIRKWFHVALRMQNTIMDVYVNGIITGRIVLQDVPKQNYNDVNICQNGGFAGQLSNLRYFSRALNAFEINSIVNSGPDATPNGIGSTTPSGYYTYLSNMWYSPNYNA
jgi:hypothetical protein